MGRSSSSSTTEQTITNTQDIDTEQVSAEGEGNLVLNADGPIHFAPTDLGAVDSAFDFAEQIGVRAVETVASSQERSQKALTDAIGKVADASRSDTTETFRRVALYAAIAVAVIFVAMQVRKAKA